MKKAIIFLAYILILNLWSCQKITNTEPPVIDPSTKTTKDLVIPTTFSFETSKEVSVGIIVQNSNSILSAVPVSIYLNYPGTSEVPNTEAVLVGTFTSKADGRIDAILKLPQAQDSLYLTTKFIGLESESGFAINGSTASYTYGAGNNLKSAYLPQPETNQFKASIIYTYRPEGYNSVGRPKYLVTPQDPISQKLLNDINASLPEGKRLTVSHPEYVKATNEGDVVLKEQADVWITFVSEGAGYMNSIGYYTYKSATPPTSASQISTRNIIFPNASLPGSGGALQSGDKVLLGRFPAGTGIGWFIVANGWNGSLVSGQTIYYSEPVFNPETDATKRQHSVLLKNSSNSLFLLAFEDLNRVTGGSDDDFNDAVFYVTSNPATAIETVNVPPIDSPIDTDSDGVTDSFDEFPKDPLRAHSNYYPAKDQYNSLVVEDLWPSLGDFDFNDLVIDCNYKEVTNTQNNVVEMFIKLKVRAIGASYKNGFGIQLPVAASAVSTVTLTDQSGAVKNIGVEAGQAKAVVIAFDNAFTLLPSPGGIGVNVVTGNTYREPKDIELHILFATPQTTANLGTAPFNPFVTVNGDRTKEIHLANSIPTGKASAAYFGQGDDTSNPASSRYYKSKKNLVWMMEVPSSFSYSIEKDDIIKVYLKFGTWAESGGSLYKDWYMDKSGYRNNSLIYKN